MMDTIEAFLSGEKQEEWLHLAEDVGTAPDYIIQHEQNRTEAQLENLEYDTKYRAEPNENYTE